MSEQQNPLEALTPEQLHGLGLSYLAQADAMSCPDADENRARNYAAQAATAQAFFFAALSASDLTAAAERKALERKRERNAKSAAAALREQFMNAAGLPGTVLPEPPRLEQLLDAIPEDGTGDFGPDAYRSHRPGCTCPDCAAYR